MKKPAAPATVRVAIYTRKSTEEGLDQEFNSLDAQRAAVEAFVQSQRGEGWLALQDHYDDGGFTGANIERPAFQRLMKEVAAGRVDVVAVYKIDRLSRSLLDFVRIMQSFTDHGVTFVSVTQQFNTTTSMGRLTMNLLASFAEFEREVISERTRDKIAATRRKGHYTGGRPILGFDVVEKKLVVNPAEAAEVRVMFGIYLEKKTLAGTVAELRRRGIRQKLRTTRKGQRQGGHPFDKTSLRHHLQNALYIGRVPFKGETFQGIHERIIDDETFDAVQHQLRQHAKSGGSSERNKWGVLLRGLLRCGVCGTAMTHHWTQKGARRHSYYVCEKMLKGRAVACPGSRIAVAAIETAVVENIRGLGADASVLRATLQAAREAANAARPALEAERRRLEGKVAEHRNERGNLLAAIAEGTPGTRALTERLASADSEAEAYAARIYEVKSKLKAIDDAPVQEDDFRGALATFDPVWNELFPKERARILTLLLESVVFTGKTGEVSITFRPSGIRALAAKASA